MVSGHGEARERIVALEDVPNIGKAIAADLRRIGIVEPSALRGQDPYRLYARLCKVTRTRHDPCLLDTFIAAVSFMDGAPARPWWTYTAERKRTLARAGAERPIAAERSTASGAKPLHARRDGASDAAKPIARLANLGPVSARMLASAGIESVERLRSLGAVEAFRLVRAKSPRASLNLLWALQGALTGRPWQVVAREDRLGLLLQLEPDRLRGA